MFFCKVEREREREREERERERAKWVAIRNPESISISEWTGITIHDTAAFVPVCDISVKVYLVTLIGNLCLLKSNVAYDVIIEVAHDVINYVTKYSF